MLSKERLGEMRERCTKTIAYNIEAGMDWTDSHKVLSEDVPDLLSALESAQAVIDAARNVQHLNTIDTKKSDAVWTELERSLTAYDQATGRGIRDPRTE